MNHSMATMTLEQLRARAKALGLKSYSKLKKAALERLVAQAEQAGNDKRAHPAPAPQPTVKAPEPAPPVSAKPRYRDVPTAVPTDAKPLPREAPVAAPTDVTPAPRVPATPPPAPAHPEPDAQLTPRAAGAEESAEQRIETAKYAVVAPGMALGARRLADLGEDIDRLPAMRSAQLTLLPQKPGILCASWALPAGFGVAVERLRLRLCRLAGQDIEVLEETPLPAARGQWYFHVPLEPELGLYGAHLGYYNGGGFVSAMELAVARIPTLYASSALDRRWRVSEAQFRAMYLRAGGVLRTDRLAWLGATSSPGGAAPGERLLWPGGISSR